MKKSITISPRTHPDYFAVELLWVLVETGLCESRSEARRLIRQGGIRIDNEKIPAILADGQWYMFDVDGTILSRGKTQYARLVWEGNPMVLEVDYDCLS